MVLKNHLIANDNIRSSELADGELSSVNGPITVVLDSLALRGSNNEKLIPITTTDIYATNGVLHKIDGVLLPE